MASIEAIIDRETWEATQRSLAGTRPFVRKAVQGEKAVRDCQGTTAPAFSPDFSMTSPETVFHQSCQQERCPLPLLHLTAFDAGTAEGCHGWRLPARHLITS